MTDVGKEKGNGIKDTSYVHRTSVLMTKRYEHLIYRAFDIHHVVVLRGPVSVEGLLMLV